MDGRNAHDTQQITPLHLVTNTKKHFIFYNSNKKQLLQVLKSKNSSIKDIKNLDNELKVAKSITHPAFRSSIKRTTYENKEALLLEWAPGIPINQLKKNTVSVKDFLLIAREIVSSLFSMHMKNIMHMNLTCEHIIFHEDKKEKIIDLTCEHSTFHEDEEEESSIPKSIKIIGCGSSTNFDSKSKYLSNQELLENKDLLRYISPEQTGRVNRDIDYRSDFYSLGIVFYRLLTGRYPFEHENTWKLLHLQIYQDPLPVHNIDPMLPISLSKMISKLMEKNADDRYQSTKGLMHDLDLMISEYENDETLNSIELIRHDVPETLFTPQKLYGQSNNYQKLLAAFTRAKRSSFEIVFVSGNSGTGKSAFVYELRKPVIQRDGIFICGKYDSFSAEPYSALVEAVNNFCNDLLLRDEFTISKYKHQILKAIGDEGGLLTNVITNLRLIIGDQSCAPYDVFGQEAKNRFNYVFIKFIKAICFVGHPIVVALEDLQWMDVESLNLLSNLMQHLKSIKKLMVIGIYRENEVTIRHSVTNLTQIVREAKCSLTHIKTENLDHEGVNELLSDALSILPYEAYPLTAMFHEKTHGNPFFVKQMLKHLLEQGSIFFCNDASKWKWDATIFGTSNVYASVKQLIRLKILSYDEHTQQALKSASCIGNSFSLRILKVIVNRSDGIEGAISSGLIVQHKGSDTEYHFVHDHIQDAAFSLLPDNPNAIFLYIGNKLRKLLSKKELYEHIFVVVRLLQNTIESLKDNEDRSQIVELFIQAGNKAMLSTAFTKAFEYLEAAMDLLGQDCWNKHYDLSLKLHYLTAQSAYCMSDYVRMDAIIDEIFKNATSSLHLVKSFSLKIKYLTDGRNFEDAISAAVCILDKLDERILDGRCLSMTASKVSNLKNCITETSEENILNLKSMEDDRLLSVMVLLDGILHSCFFANPQLLASASARIVQLTLKHGISKFAPTGFAVFGSVLCIQGDQLGYKLGKVAIKLLKKIRVKEKIPPVYLSYFGMIGPYHISLHDLIDPFKSAYSVSLEIGSHSNCVLSGNSFCSHAFLSGKSLVQLREDLDDLAMTLPAVKTKQFLSIYQAAHIFLDERRERPALLTGPYFDHMSCFDKNEKAFDKARSSLVCCIVACLFHDYNLALQFVEICRPLQGYIKAFLFYPTLLFYDSLILLAISRDSNEKYKWMNIIQDNLSKLKVFSQSVPENYLNKCYLIEAEMASIFNNELAMLNYRSSIALSKKHNFIHEEALACEKAAMFLFRSGSASAGEDLLLQAYACYETWGAVAKMRQLRIKYPSMLHQVENSAARCGTELQLENNSSGTVSLLSENAFSTNSSMSEKRKRRRI